MIFSLSASPIVCRFEGGTLTPVKMLAASTVPWHPSPSCDPGKYYMINNLSPGFLPNGAVDSTSILSGAKVPPSNLRTIGDALNDKNISWAYYGGGYNAAVNVANHSKDPYDQLIGGNYCDICNPFSYATSIMGNATQRGKHIKDVIDFLNDVDNGKLPAVSYVKPDSLVDGHPASSKLILFEAMIDNIHDKLKAHPDLFAETALFVTFDEGGGFWDSGTFAPLDFFGDGPRIPMIVISPYSTGGKVVHSYNDHASVVKFIERNWGLGKLSSRSRDNLKNPTMDLSKSYVPTNAPAVGDLFDMFCFGDFGDDNSQGDTTKAATTKAATVKAATTKTATAKAATTKTATAKAATAKAATASNFA